MAITRLATPTFLWSVRCMTDEKGSQQFGVELQVHSSSRPLKTERYWKGDSQKIRKTIHNKSATLASVVEESSYFICQHAMRPDWPSSVMQI